MSTQPSSAILETFTNQYPDRNYEISITCPEWTALCPNTGQPDFATIRITYVPDELCVELKSLKLYMYSYRDQGEFHEHVTNRILDDLVTAIKPRRATVVGDFNVRGGIKTIVTAAYPGQKTEDRGQKIEIRDQRSEVRGQKSEDRGL